MEITRYLSWVSIIQVMIRAVRKSRIHDRRDYRDFRHVPWFLAIAVISCYGREYWRIICDFSFKRSLLSKFRSTFAFRLCTGYAHGHLINFAYLLAASKWSLALLSLRFWDVFLCYFIKFRMLMLERGGVSCSHYFSCFTFMVETIT